MKVTVMKGRKQKISLHQRPVAQNNRTASESYATRQTFLWITENNLTEHEYRKTNGLLEDILSPSNLNAAYKRGYKFVRYADDLVILCKSRRSADRTKESISSYIEKKLFLKVNRDKTKVAHIRDIKFLGYSFYRYKGECRLRIHPKSVEKMKARIRELTSRRNGWGNERRKLALNQYIKGWVQYFKLADIKTLLTTTDAWLRRRLRMVIWKQWKRIRTKVANLVKLGINRYKAYEWANTRKGYWHVANSFILSQTVTDERLRKAGYVFFSDYYKSVRV